eukprot:RCo000784
MSRGTTTMVPCTVPTAVHSGMAAMVSLWVDAPRGPPHHQKGHRVMASAGLCRARASLRQHCPVHPAPAQEDLKAAAGMLLDFSPPQQRLKGTGTLMGTLKCTAAKEKLKRRFSRKSLPCQSCCVKKFTRRGEGGFFRQPPRFESLTCGTGNPSPFRSVACLARRLPGHILLHPRLSALAGVVGMGEG